jgi:hypothetical protein
LETMPEAMTHTSASTGSHPPCAFREPRQTPDQRDARPFAPLRRRVKAFLLPTGNWQLFPAALPGLQTLETIQTCKTCQACSTIIAFVPAPLRKNRALFSGTPALHVPSPVAALPSTIHYPLPAAHWPSTGNWQLTTDHRAASRSGAEWTIH